MTKYNSQMRLIILRSSGVLYDAKDEELLAGYSWFIMNCGYAMARSNKKNEPEKILMHRLIMDVVNDKTATVDHINRDKLDNRRENLRLVSRSQNVLNSDRSDSSTYITKRADSGSYRVQIKREGVMYSKTTKTIAEAQAWRDGFLDGSISSDGWTPKNLQIGQHRTLHP